MVAEPEAKVIGKGLDATGGVDCVVDAAAAVLLSGKAADTASGCWPVLASGRGLPKEGAAAEAPKKGVAPDAPNEGAGLEVPKEGAALLAPRLNERVSAGEVG